MFRKILIANRGEIAVRVTRSLREMGIASVAVYTEPDRTSLHARFADEAFSLGDEPRAYLDAERVLEIARRSGAEAIHPGYGFLSENADFARACEAAGLAFVGPSADAIFAMGSKQRARELMARAGVPIVPGGDARSFEEARATAERVGYPVLVKATDGGGGKGMRLVRSEGELAQALERTRSEAEKAFGSGAVYIEKALEKARHVEVQVLGDRHGNLIHLFERDCSLQRRHQKVVEETPCPALSPETRRALCDVAVQGARSIGYYSAGTFEFLLAEDGSFYFLEMNTRLQVEHPITELVTGVDLVREMVRVAAGEKLELEPIEARGAAIEARIYAEDPSAGFLPSPGKIGFLKVPAGPFVRDDGGVYEGMTVTPFYDPLLSKLCVWAPTRELALRRLSRALAEYQVGGVTTNVAFLQSLIESSAVRAGEYDTNFIERELGALNAPRGESLDPLWVATALAVDLERVAPSTKAPAASGAELSPWLAEHRARLR